MTVGAGMGIPEDNLCLLIINPETKRPIAPMTLRKHFREELDKGFVQANAKVGMGLFKNATEKVSDSFPHGLPIAQMFWLKCRARWQQNPHLVPPPPTAPSVQRDDADVARRLAFLLAREGAKPTKKKVAA